MDNIVSLSRQFLAVCDLKLNSDAAFAATLESSISEEEMLRIQEDVMTAATDDFLGFDGGQSHWISAAEGYAKVILRSKDRLDTSSFASMVDTSSVSRDELDVHGAPSLAEILQLD